MWIMSHQRFLSNLVAIFSQLIMFYNPNQPFRIMVSNFSNKPVHLPKLMYVALVVYLPYGLLKFPTNDETETFNAIHH